MTALIIISVLIVLFLITCAAFFFIAFVRDEREDKNDLNSKANRFFGKYRESVQAGMDYIDSAECEKCTVKSFDGLKLFARYFKNKDSNDTIILFHGYRSTSKRDFCCAVKMYMDMGLNILLVDQRSHGESEGRLITFGVKEHKDVLTWVNFLNDEYGKNIKIFLGGMSMGATTVLLSAGLKMPENVRGIIADCGFTAPVDIIKRVSRQAFHIWGFIMIPAMNILCGIFGKFSIYGISTTTALKNNKIPLLFIHGKADNFVPCEMSKQGYASAGGEKYIYLVDGAGHGFSYFLDTEGVKKRLTDFINRHRV